MANPLSILAPALAKLRIPIPQRFVPHAKAISMAPEAQQFIQNRTVEATTPMVRPQYSALGQAGSMALDMAPFLIKNTPTGIVAQEFLAPSYANAIDEINAIKSRNRYNENVQYSSLRDINRGGLK